MAAKPIQSKRRLTRYKRRRKHIWRHVSQCAHRRQGVGPFAFGILGFNLCPHGGPDTHFSNSLSISFVPQRHHFCSTSATYSYPPSSDSSLYGDARNALCCVSLMYCRAFETLLNLERAALREQTAPTRRPLEIALLIAWSALAAPELRTP
jgi:hypothetical protein